MKKVRVLIVHESLAWRAALRGALASVDRVDVVGASPTGRLALQKLQRCEPAVMLLSVTLPDAPAAEIARAALANPGMVVLGMQHGAGAESHAAACLRAGFAEIVEVPQAPSAEQVERVIECILAHAHRAPRATAAHARVRESSSLHTKSCAAPSAARGVIAKPRGAAAVEVVVIGASTGGPSALARVLADLPHSFPVPVAAVVHVPDAFSASLAESLDHGCALPVKEAVDGDIMLPGHVYIAGPGTHLALGRSPAGQLFTRLKGGPPENGVRPSVDVLFRHAGQVCGGATLAVIMTGMGADGSLGIEALRRTGALVLAQDEASSVVWGMPGRAVHAGLVDEVIALEQLGARIQALVVRQP